VLFSATLFTIELGSARRPVTAQTLTSCGSIPISLPSIVSETPGWFALALSVALSPLSSSVAT